LGLLVFAFAAGRAVVMGVSPLALGAVLAARPLFGSFSLAMALASAAGVLTVKGAGGLVTAGLLLLLFPLYGLLRRAVPASWLGPLLGAVLGAALPFPNVAPLTALAAAAMSAAAALGLGWLAAPLAQRSRTVPREAAAAGLALVAGAGLAHLHPAGFDLPYAAAVAFVLVALLRRPGGVALAPLAGLVLTLTGEISPIGIVDLALGAALASLARGFGRPAAAGLFLLGDLVLAADHLAAADLAGQVLAAVVGALAVTFLPERLVVGDAPAPVPRPGPPVAAERLADVAYVLREMAAAFYEATEAAAGGADPYAAGLDVINQRVCQGCRHHDDCWRDGFYATYRSVLDLVAERPRGEPVTAADLPAELRRKCPRPKEVALAISFVADLQVAEELWRRREQEARALVADQIRGAAAVVDRLGQALGETEPKPPPTLSYATGLAKLAKGGMAISGDSYLVRELADGRLVLGLADGMGVGPKAFLESSAVVSMVEKLLALGLGQEVVLRTVNAALVMRSHDDMFSTLDLALVDLASGETELIKIGSPPTFLCHAGEVEVLTGRSVPIGILRHVEWEVFYRRLAPGDLLVMVSDGVAEVGGHEWLADLLPTLSRLDPQEIAERILDEALERAKRRRDDMTVLATQLVEAEDELPEVQAWVRRASRPPGIVLEHAGNAGESRRR
jgi:hypothetical protein